MVERFVSIEEAAGSMPAFSTFTMNRIYRNMQALPKNQSPDRLGGVAQMVERLVCIEEAAGSMPAFSTFTFACT